MAIHRNESAENIPLSHGFLVLLGKENYFQKCLSFVSEISSSSKNELSYSESKSRIPPIDSNNSRRSKRSQRQSENNGIDDR